jgi:hypothetical protein
VISPVLTVGELSQCSLVRASWTSGLPDTGFYSLQWTRVLSDGTYDFNNYTKHNVRGTSAELPNWFEGRASYAMRVFSMRADWDGIWHSNQNVTSHSTPVVFIVPYCPSVVSSTTTTVAQTCAQGGVCSVGDTGPGGGIVFYVASANFTSTGSDCDTSCRYLEAAPNGWGVSSSVDDNCAFPGNASDDPGCVWSGNTTGLIGGTAQGTAVGSGYSNTQAAVGQAGGGNTADRAITAAWGYTNNGKSDWHLPSKDELNELCKYSRTQTTGDTSVQCSNTGSQRSGFSGGYWGSNEVTNVNAWHQSFSSGSRGQTAKSTTSWKVRPVRAFGQ